MLISTHACHPSLANDNLSGLVVDGRARARARGAAAAPALLPLPLRPRHDRRHHLAGAQRGEDREDRARPGRGRVWATAAPSTTRRAGAATRRSTARCPSRSPGSGSRIEIEDFVPFGYDERQYNSPGFALPVGSLTRTPWGRYPEYHTSADDLDFIRPEHLERSLAAYRAVVDLLDGNAIYRNRSPKGEPMLGRRGLYRSIGGDDAGRERELALLWVLNLSDGVHDLLDDRRARRSSPSPASAKPPTACSRRTCWSRSTEAERVAPGGPLPFSWS